MDKYLGFKYRGVEIGIDKVGEHIPGFIINEEIDLRFFGVPGFMNERIEPLYGNSSYYTGTTISHKEIPLNLAFKEITLAQYKDILRLFDPKKQGMLIFDFNPDFGFNVKPESIEEGNFQVVYNDQCVEGQEDNPDLYNLELTVVFTTVNDWAAIYKDESKGELQWDLQGNEWSFSSSGLQFMEYTNTTPETTIANIVINNNLKLPNYITAIFYEDTGIEIKKGAEEILIVDSAILANYESPYKYFSQYGILIDNEGKFIPCSVCKTLSLEEEESISLSIEHTYWVKIFFSGRDLL